MTFFCKNASFRLQKNIFIFFTIVLFTFLLVSVVNQVRKAPSQKRPYCFKGYICQAAIKNIYK